jgi:hypothetical protein
MLYKLRSPNVVGRRESQIYMNMYRGKNRKAIYNDVHLKAIDIDEYLYIEVKPLFNSSIVFVEHEDGTEVVHLVNDIKINSFIHPFIKPRNIVSNGKLIPDELKAHFKEILATSFEGDFWTQEKFDKLDDVNKTYFVDKCWDMSHTLVYKIIRD